MGQHIRHREHPQDAWRSTNKTYGLPRREWNHSLLAMTLLMGVSALMAGCIDQTSIQTDYVSERSRCQGEAESRIDDYAGEIAADDVRAKNAKLVTLFSDCMFERGWTVASPNRETPKPEDNPLEAARKAPDQPAQPAAQPAPAPAPQQAPPQSPVYYQQQQQAPAPQTVAPAPLQQQQAPLYYVPAPAPIYPQQKIAPNTPQQPPVYYQQVPAPQQAPVYYQQVPAPAPQQAPVYYQQVPAPQGYAPQPAAPIYNADPGDAAQEPATGQAPALVRQ